MNVHQHYDAIKKLAINNFITFKASSTLATRAIVAENGDNYSRQCGRGFRTLPIKLPECRNSSSRHL